MVTEDREQRADLHVGERFLHRLACRPVLHGFAVLHESGRHGPEAVARLDRPFAHEDLAVHVDDAPGNDLRILIVDRRAGRTDVARQVVAFRGFLRDRLAAGGTELHADESLNAALFSSQ
jgi:hypothetical protein